MRPSYYRRRNAFFSSPGRIIAALALLLALVLIIIRLFAPGAFFALTAPLFKAGIVFTPLREQDIRLRADRILENENAALREEVRDLMRLIGAEQSAREGVVAAVLARPPLAPYDTLIIEAGTERGVREGFLVFAEGGIPIGTVHAADARYAQVSLYSTAGRTNEGWAGDERVPITLIGGGAGAFLAEVPLDASIFEGAFVYLPPGGIPVGKVVRVDADASSPSATLRIAPLVNVFSLTDVFVALP